MSTLYDVSQRWQSLDDIVTDAASADDISPDEVSAIVAKLLDELQCDSEGAVRDGVQYLRNLEALRDAKRAEARALSEGARSLDDRIGRIKDVLRQFVDWRFAGHIVAGPYDVRTRAVPPSVVLDDVDPEALPERFRKVSYSADKTAIKAALKHGEPLNFARLGDAVRALTIK